MRKGPFLNQDEKSRGSRSQKVVKGKCVLKRESKSCNADGDSFPEPYDRTVIERLPTKLEKRRREEVILNL